jgi:exopolyphosphatase/guanosine-5'-triphosphate,3'-diphosphate pyrophosphatase
VRVGAVDIGTNTVRLLVRDASTELARRIEVVGLGVGVDATGMLSPEAIERTAVVLGEFGVTMRSLGVERIRAVATSATRDAPNAADFLDRAHGLLGVRPEVITGDAEAVLSFRGAAGAITGAGPSLVIDVGGGSTEFVYGEGSIEYARSIDIGSVRLTDRVLPQRPASEEQVAAATRHVADAFRAIHLPAAPQRVIGVAGTFTALAAVHLGLEVYDRTRVHRSTMRLVDLDTLVQRLSPLTVAETAVIPSMDPKRAPVLLAGAVIVAESVRLAGSEVIVSEYDLLDALAEGLLE